MSKNKLPRQAFKLWILAFVATALISSLFTATPVSAQTSTDATLSGITLSQGTLSPVFASATTTYRVSIPDDATTITVGPTATDSAATISINSGTAATGSTSEAVTLTAGSNTITIVVTATDTTTTMTYTIIVRPSTDATLSAITLSEGTLFPGFDSASSNYQTAVGLATTSLTVGTTATDSAATISTNSGTAATGSDSQAISISGLSTRITILVTAEDTTTTMTYSILVLRPFSYGSNTLVYTNHVTIQSYNLGSPPLVANANQGTTNTEIDGSVRSSYNLPYLEVAYELRVFRGGAYYPITTVTTGVGWSSVATHITQINLMNSFVAKSCTESVVNVVTSPTFAPPSSISSSIESTFLPYVRQITLTEDDDDTTTTDTTDPLNLGGTASSTADYNVCILPEALQASSALFPDANNPVNAYTPPTGWVVKDPNIVTLITPSATSTFTVAGEVATTDGGTVEASAEVVVSFDPAVTKTGNGFSSLSWTSTGIVEDQLIDCLPNQNDAINARDFFLFTPEQLEALLCEGVVLPDAQPTTPTTTTTTTFSPSAQPPTLGSLVPGTTNLAVSCGFRLLGQCQNLPDFHSPAIKVNTGVDLFDFSIKAMSPDRPLKEFYLGFGLPRVGAPIQSAKASVTIELAQNPDSIVGYDIVDVKYQGIENPNAYFWLSLEPCSRFSNAICIVASIGDLELYEGFEVEPMAIQVTDTSGETSRYYLAG